MSTTMDILKRPFSVEPITNVMLPDGIFTSAIFVQRITCYYTNTGPTPLTDVEIYLESVGDPGIVPVAKTHTFAEIKPGASVLVDWEANFQNASPGKPFVSFIATADGDAMTRVIKQIYVAKMDFNPATHIWTCTVPEGTMTMSPIKAIGPRERHRGCDETGQLRPAVGPWIPTGMNITVTPNPAYAGVTGDLPFQDPWWKILAWIIAFLAAIGAIIAASEGEGTAAVAVEGSFDETTGEVDCCEPDPEGTAELGTGIAGVLSTVASGAAIVGMTDSIDPWRKGELATPPAPGELTLSESLAITFTYTEAPNAGVPYPVEVNWTFMRVTTGGTYTHSATEMPVNTHTIAGKQVNAPAVVPLSAGKFSFTGRFLKTPAGVFAGSELAVYAIVVTPSGHAFYVPMVDSGTSPDATPNDGLYTGEMNLRQFYARFANTDQSPHGFWRIHVFAQDVNDATPGMAPEVAATHIGGMMVASAVTLTFDVTAPCPLTADAVVHVI